MAALVAVYKTPKSLAAFNDYYFAKHVPIAKTIPGLRNLRVSDGPVGLPVEPGAVHLVATLEFDSVEVIQQALTARGAGDGRRSRELRRRWRRPDGFQHQTGLTARAQAGCGAGSGPASCSKP